MADTLKFINATLNDISEQFHRLPGSAMVLRYIRSSHQDDPIRSALELSLFLFAVRYLLTPKVRQDKTYVKLTEEEVDELIEDWQPEPLVAPLTEGEAYEIEKLPVIQGLQGSKVKINGRTIMHMASYNFLNLQGMDQLKEQAIQTLRIYGVGACSPPGFYGTQDVHMQIESDLLNFLGMEACIVYAQAYTTNLSVIPAFAKRGDIIVA